MPDLPIVIGIIIAVIIFGLLAMFVTMYKKVPQGKAMVKTGLGGLKVSFNGLFVVPVIHKLEIMDISVKKIEIQRLGKDGLICKDNMRADIKVAFFIRVNPVVESVEKVAQTIGTERASDITTLNTLFEAKFSEALKTVGKKFDFIDLYDSRSKFKWQILEEIGKDLNGYVLDDCAIDYLEQTDIQHLKADNILDSEGIKKITELTATQNMLANKIRREEEKTITEQNVEAKEAILELNRQLKTITEQNVETKEAILELDRQLAEKEQRQRREIENIKAREQAEMLETKQKR